MNKTFKGLVEGIPSLYEQLVSVEPIAITARSSFGSIPAIYVFYEGDKPVHVGRTRNLKQRLSGHTQNSHYSASFAFKRARIAGGYERASYQSKDSRSDLAKGALKSHFQDEIAKVRNMKVRFLLVSNPIEQYLLELYAQMEFNFPLDEFNTH